ncbi:GNAT family N-acetyltransferase [Chiayiivirga flava]|uniref:GNAT superfamily N-acetyltransferase n=1 Tax=Chiayiivirga flava TaxID=659595 RepID=A0A7W8FZ09_9GAMM|nr:GNAT family N-acetyltransferase [Chiayiivirga flava]MBB5207967.1 GNAT superfamily N-acetyltransferase [Chiayiivirga flava]
MSDSPTHRTIAVRDANSADIDLLARWAIAMALETEHKTLDPDTVRRGIAALFAQPQRGRYLVAERDGAAAGTLMLTHEWSDWRCGDWWWIQSVYIVPAHRRHGVFRALYHHVATQARADAGVCGLRLYVERDNAVAQRTYAALGMEDAGYRMFEIALPRRLDNG